MAAGRRAPNFNNDRAAKVLVDAALFGDRQAAQMHGIGIRSVERWRSRLATDETFRAVFQELRQLKNDQWAKELPAALASSIHFLTLAGQTADPKDPNAITAIANAVSVLADIALTQRMIDERIRAVQSEAG
jgi:hypothetical protein